MRSRMVMEIRKRLSSYESHTQDLTPDKAAVNTMPTTSASIHDLQATRQCAPRTQVLSITFRATCNCKRGQDFSSVATFVF